MNEDYVVSSRWTGRPDRDYIPPGGMRSCDTDADAEDAARVKPSVSTQTFISDLQNAGLAEAQNGGLTLTDKVEKNQNASPVTATECRIPTEKVATPPRQATSAAKQMFPSKKERNYVPAREAPRMTCDICGSNKLKCVDSRPEPEGRYRRYKCLDCGENTHTREVKLK